MIEHIEDDVEFLRNAVKLLVPGGRVYATVPAFQSLWSADDVASGHFRRYRVAALEAILKRAGLRVEYSTYFFWILPLPLFLLRVLLPELGLRRNDAVADAPREHAVGHPFVRAVAEKLFRPELRLVRAQSPFPSAPAVSLWVRTSDSVAVEDRQTEAGQSVAIAVVEQVAVGVVVEHERILY